MTIVEKATMDTVLYWFYRHLYTVRVNPFVNKMKSITAEWFSPEELEKAREEYLAEQEKENPSPKVSNISKM
jgi:hypothetical protein